MGFLAVIRCRSEAPDKREVGSSGSSGLLEAGRAPIARPAALTCRPRPRLEQPIGAYHGGRLTHGDHDVRMSLDMASNSDPSDRCGFPQQVPAQDGDARRERYRVGSPLVTVRVWNPSVNLGEHRIEPGAT